MVKPPTAGRGVINHAALAFRSDATPLGEWRAARGLKAAIGNKD